MIWWRPCGRKWNDWLAPKSQSFCCWSLLVVPKSGLFFAECLDWWAISARVSIIIILKVFEGQNCTSEIELLVATHVKFRVYRIFLFP